MKLSALVTVAGVAYATAQEYVRCGAPDPTEAEATEADEVVRVFTEAMESGTAAFGAVIDTYVHVVTSVNKEGDYTQAQVNAQIDAMNEQYAATGYSFNLVDTDFTTNRRWAFSNYGGPAEYEMKSALHKGSYADLNLYFLSNLGQGLLGYCYFPTANPTAEELILDGCVNLADSMPGGAATNYNLGYTAVHETGHWFGLYHVFQGGSCKSLGDRVRDTPEQKTPTSGCPNRKDTCPGRAGLDSIHNFMDYSYDTCYEEFTNGQINRMRAQYEKYRAGQ